MGCRLTASISECRWRARRAPSREVPCPTASTGGLGRVSARGDVGARSRQHVSGKKETPIDTILEIRRPRFSRTRTDLDAFLGLSSIRRWSLTRLLSIPCSPPSSRENEAPLVFCLVPVKCCIARIRHTSTAPLDATLETASLCPGLAVEMRLQKSNKLRQDRKGKEKKKRNVLTRSINFGENATLTPSPCRSCLSISHLAIFLLPCLPCLPCLPRSVSSALAFPCVDSFS